MHLNFEFKAKVDDLNILENKLQSLNPKFIGTDHQVDTYFNAKLGRLKLREGNIENALIHYLREDEATAKTSKVILYQHNPNSALKSILEISNGIKVVVDKQRKIYFIENVKLHFDYVESLGAFIEVEAIDNDGTIGLQKLKEQCDFYINFFEIKSEQFIDKSYSDLLL